MLINRTDRGLELVEFRDFYNHECSLQQSSLATTQALWLGKGDQRMHLSVDQVKSLIDHLKAWVDTGSFAT